jgi:hypothetical protein
MRLAVLSVVLQRLPLARFLIRVRQGSPDPKRSRQGEAGVKPVFLFPFLLSLRCE